MQIPNIAKVDSYKLGHFLQYRPGTQYVSSYIEARGCDRDWNQMVFSGMQYFLQTYMSRPLVTEESLERMARRAKLHGVSFNYDGFKYILDKHCGYAPVRIQALPEGSVVPLGTPLVQVVNTDPNVPWITSYIETALLRAIWYPTTVATLSFQIKKTIKEYMLKTAGHTDGIDFKLHDFGARGVSSSESAQIGGMAHLLSFKGTDNLEALEMIDRIYGEEMAGFSIDAAEHSTITSFGGPEMELEAFRQQIKQLSGPNKIFAIVSDTFNIFDAVSQKFGVDLHGEILKVGESGGKLVIRPDSGDPVEIVSDIIERLMDKFGFTVNSMGYKVLPPYIGVIQGDGINEKSIRAILAEMDRNGLSAENIAFGMGGALLQGVNRDTLKFAMKASAICNEVDGWYDIQKSPVTDTGKKSKKGRQFVGRTSAGLYITTPEKPIEQFLVAAPGQNLLQDVYIDGRVLKSVSIGKIRERVEAAL
jgi:nicotinamide phosphoribosyltransferase